MREAILAKEMMVEQAEQRLAAVLGRLVNEYQVAQAIHVAATLGIADLLKDGLRRSDNLAAATDSNPAGRSQGSRSTLAHARARRRV